jgi:hypothetical protein
MKSSKFLILLTLATLLVMVASTPANAVSYNLTARGNEYTIHDGTIIKAFTPADSSGTGVFNAFLRISDNGTIVEGYNSDYKQKTKQFQEDPAWTESWLLEDVPIIDIDGTWYREFQLDINQNANDTDALISVDEVEVWITNNEPSANGHLYPGDFNPGNTYELVWNLDGPADNVILLNFNLNPGSGKRDFALQVPHALFGDKTYVVLYVHHGADAYTGEYDLDADTATTDDIFSVTNGVFGNNDGFEEWGVAVYPPIPDISITKTADIDEFCLSDAPYPVTYTYEVQNTGNEDLDSVVVTDDTCSSPTYVSGDDGDGLLNPLEVWIYECTTLLDGATTNTGTVVATGVESGTDVTDSDTAFVDVVEVAVTIEPAAAEICEGDDPVQLCAVASLGSGDYSYLWSTAETSECIYVDIGGTYSVTVTDNITGCQDTAEATLSVISAPVCSILGPDEVCADDVEILYESEYTADSYYWEISGDAVINGANDGPTVLVDATGVGGFTLTLTVCNDGDVIECCDSCFLNVTTYPCAPGIQIDKYPDIDMFCLSDVPVPVTYIYDVYTTGDEALVDVDVYDDTCGPLTRLADDPGNNDDILELGEVWVFECSTDLYDTTTNTAAADGYGIFSDEYVYAEDTATVTGYEVTVEVTPPVAEICEGGEPVELTANVTLGTGDYSYLWDTGETTQSIFVDEAGEYCVTVTDNITGCVAEACANLYVIDIPDCSIEGPDSLCVGDEVQFCATVSDAYSYVWVIALGSEYAEIVGDDTGDCVTVRATGEGTFTLGLNICYAGDVVVCCDECSTEVLVEPCGGAYCSFTQGFWGNEGGTGCDPGVSTTDLLIALLDAPDASTPGADPVIVGQLGVRSITFDTGNCILMRLPTGGSPKALPDFGDKNCADTDFPNKLLFSDGRFKNVLIGQVVALTLNLRLYPGCLDDGAYLGSYVLPDSPFCTIPYDQPEACVEQFEIPEELQGLTVDQLLDTANAALAGDTTYKISDIYKAVTAVNEAFDECRIIVPCIRPEICDNGCDDDGDGDVDCDDTQCYGVGDCPDPTAIETL